MLDFTIKYPSQFKRRKYPPHEIQEDSASQHKEVDTEIQEDSPNKTKADTQGAVDHPAWASFPDIDV